jgi:hypothetical protein
MIIHFKQFIYVLKSISIVPFQSSIPRLTLTLSDDQQQNNAATAAMASMNLEQLLQAHHHHHHPQTIDSSNGNNERCSVACQLL